jgi:hypothetical protein
VRDLLVAIKPPFDNDTGSIIDNLSKEYAVDKCTARTAPKHDTLLIGSKGLEAVSVTPISGSAQVPVSSESGTPGHSICNATSYLLSVPAVKVLYLHRDPKRSGEGPNKSITTVNNDTMRSSLAVRKGSIGAERGGNPAPKPGTLRTHTAVEDLCFALRFLPAVLWIPQPGVGISWAGLGARNRA